jgi:hypothetical protein
MRLWLRAKLIYSKTVVAPTSPTYTWADEALTKHEANRPQSNGSTNPDFITSANNPAENTAIESGNRRGRMNLQAFDEAWRSKE